MSQCQTYQRCGATLYSWGEGGGARQLLDALPRLPALHGSSHSSSCQAQGDTDQPHSLGRLHSRRGNYGSLQRLGLLPSQKNVLCWIDAPQNLRRPSLPSQAYTVGVLVTFFDQAVVVQVKHQHNVRCISSISCYKHSLLNP